MNKVISVKNFSKSFGSNKVIKDLSFNVKKGEVFAFLGENGSGKTTTIRSLLDIYQDYEGDLKVFGQKFGLQIADKIGYLPEERGLYLNMKVKDALLYFAEIKGVDRSVAENFAINYLKEIDLMSKADEVIKNLSSGQQQKIQLGITLIHNPQLLILDEPTKGLDPVNRKLLMDMLKRKNEEGVTIIFSTHLLDEVEKIADRVGILYDGRFETYGKVEKVKEDYSDRSIKVVTKDEIPENKEMYSVKDFENYYIIYPDVKFGKFDILSFLIENKVEVLEFTPLKPTLEEIFISICQRK